MFAVVLVFIGLIVGISYVAQHSPAVAGIIVLALIIGLFTKLVK